MPKYQYELREAIHSTLKATITNATNDPSGNSKRPNTGRSVDRKITCTPPRLILVRRRQLRMYADSSLMGRFGVTPLGSVVASLASRTLVALKRKRR
jgi:hypothetical protein